MRATTREKLFQVGDVCSVIKRFLHPIKAVSDKYINQDFGERLDNLLVIGLENRTINRAEKPCVLFRHDDFENVTLYASTRYVCKTVTVAQPALPVLDDLDESDTFVVIPNINREEDVANEIARLRMEGYGVDDDNEPAPENVPDTRATPDSPHPARVQYQEWGSNPFCNRRGMFNHKENASIKLNQASIGNDRVDWFIRCLPFSWIQNVLIPQTNQKLTPPMDLNEFLRFLGLLLLMSTTRVGCNIRSWFHDSEPSEFEGAPFRLQKYMSRNRFENIIRCLTYTNMHKPTFKDKFWQVRQMIYEWNQNMTEFFSPSWISCLDESISVWTNKWTCPGWMYVPRKPHPMGNEYHTIACGESGILYQMEMVEGKDQPGERRKEFDELGKTVGLLMRLTRPIWTTGKVIVLDSGFCVLRAIIEIFKVGVFASALIKKRKYWPKDVPGEDIKRYFDDKPIGVTNRLPGITSDNVKFDIFAMKEKEYVSMFMSTYGALVENEGQKLAYREAETPGQPPITFKYKEVHANHNKYKGAVDEHNNKRHDGHTGVGMSLEESWATMRWENRVFAYILATSEVNAYLCRSYFGAADHETQFEFRQKLCFDMIYYGNRQLNVATPRRTRSVSTHVLIKVPPYSKFSGGTWVRRYKQMYQQRKCSHENCKNRTRTVCTCSKDIYRCYACFSTHRVEEVISPQMND